MADKDHSYTKILVIGAGFGGIGMGVALKTMGEDAFLILEKCDNVGGVWRDNSYPGCTCDVPSHLYTFSFKPYKSRTKRFPPQQEILAYLEDVTTEYGLVSHLRLSSEVATASYQTKSSTWETATVSGQRITSEFVIFAVGQLHRPMMPEILGMDTFKGKMFHSANFDHTAKLDNKRVSIIGTGSSAAQMLPELVASVSQITIYQRTAQWVLPTPNEDFGVMGRSMLRIPGAHRLYRSALSYGADILLSPVARFHAWRCVLEFYAKRRLRSQVTNDELAKKLIPSYPIGGKRILFDNRFYPALTSHKVKLVTQPITHMSEDGIHVDDTGPALADVVICATGFRASEFLAPISIHGRDGRHLRDDWAPGVDAFLGIAVHGYPNMFLIAGPNSFNPAGSNPQMKELQISCIVRCLKWRAQKEASAIEVTEVAMKKYREWLKDKLSRTIWSGSVSVNSWYKDAKGNVTNPWPMPVKTFEKMLHKEPLRSFSLNIT